MQEKEEKKMAATFNWSIVQCERNLSDGGITTAHWTCSAEETVGSGDSAVTHTAYNYGSQGLTPDGSDGSFIAYADVSEGNVLSWIHNADVDKNAIEAGLQAQIDADKTPTTGTGVPW